MRHLRTAVQSRSQARTVPTMRRRCLYHLYQDVSPRKHHPGQVHVVPVGVGYGVCEGTPLQELFGRRLSQASDGLARFREYGDFGRAPGLGPYPPCHGRKRRNGSGAGRRGENHSRRHEKTTARATPNLGAPPRKNKDVDNKSQSPQGEAYHSCPADFFEGTGEAGYFAEAVRNAS